MKTTELTKEFLIEEYVNKQKSCSQIARENGIKCDDSVRMRLVKFYIPRRNRSTILTKEYLIENYIKQDKTTSQISEETGLALSTISWKITEYDLRKTLERRYKNKRFGLLTVLKTGPKDKDGHTLLECLCDCGEITRIPSGRLATGNTKSCGCQISFKKRGCDRTGWKGYGEISRTYWNSILKGALQRGLVFEISIEEAWDLYLKQNGECSLSGIKIYFSVNRNTNSLQTASLDRIDSSKGYTIDNIQWVHKDINRMKQHFPQDDFIEWCDRISKFQKGKT